MNETTSLFDFCMERTTSQCLANPGFRLTRQCATEHTDGGIGQENRDQAVRILIVSDIHANLVALTAVLEKAGPLDAVWNLGDTVGYGPRPRECIELMMELHANPSLTGNHDLACIGGISIQDFNHVAKWAAQWTSAELRDEHRSYLGSLPAMISIDDLTLAHASPREPVWEYIDSVPIATVNFQHFDSTACLVGHTHRAMIATLSAEQTEATIRPLRDGDVVQLDEGRCLINPGSVGQPRDRDPRAAFGILDTCNRTFAAHRVPYNISETQRQMEAAGLPDLLIARLSMGM